MTLIQDARDLGRLLTFALKPKVRAGASGDYAALVTRYRDDAGFRSAFDGLVDGLDARVLHAGDLGMVLTTRRESVFAYRLSDQGASWSKERSKVLRGIAHLGIAAYAYPHPDDLHDPVVRYVDAVPVEAFIRRACDELRVRSEAVALGGHESSDRIVDLALAAGVDAAWSEWDQMKPAEVGKTGRGSGRILSRSATYWVLRAMRDLVDHGLARQVGKDTDGRFQLLERYRHQVGAAAAESGYQALAVLRQTDTAAPDPRDPAGHHPLPGGPPMWATTPVDNADAMDDPVTDLPELDPGDDERDLATPDRSGAPQAAPGPTRPEPA